jgi:hypothetical protein
VIRVLTEHGSDVLVEVTSANKFTTNFEVRVLEALRYVLARVVQVSVIERYADGVVETELISPVRAFETRLLPPLYARSSNDRANLRRLFERYLTFVLHSQASSEFVHPCSVHLRNACEASANAIEAEAIGLCVAVEGLANLVPYERSKVDDEAFVYVQRVIKKWLTRKYNTRIRDRVTSILGQLMNDPIPKRLRSLTDTGQLDLTCVKAWGRLRNSSVHPAASKLEGLDDCRAQEFLDEIHRVYVCMYQITFALIGYEGTFSNYASDGFKIEEYPRAHAVNAARQSA